jgi:antirestriction protein ArdC
MKGLTIAHCLATRSMACRVCGPGQGCELVAELGAAFLSADFGITPEMLPDHADYIATVLKNDKRFAQRAADFLHGLQSQQMEQDRAAA